MEAVGVGVGQEIVKFVGSDRIVCWGVERVAGVVAGWGVSSIILIIVNRLVRPPLYDPAFLN